jgi:hypothetical protein
MFWFGIIRDLMIATALAILAVSALKLIATAFGQL